MIKESDHILFNSLKEGSEEAFKKVYHDNRNLFLNFAAKYGMEREDSLDVYQDAFTAFYENICNRKLVELRSAISTYLLGIGKYMIMDRMRKKKRKTNIELPMSLVQELDTEIESFDLEMEEPSAEDALLQRMLDRLGEKCKMIISLFYYKKFSIKEIMKAGNYSNENVVKSQKSRCLKTLKETYKNAMS